MLEGGLADLDVATDPREKLARLICAHPEHALEDLDRIKVFTRERGRGPRTREGCSIGRLGAAVFPMGYL